MSESRSAFGVGVTVGVGEDVGFGVGVAVGFGVDVGLVVGFGVGVGVGVGEAAGCVPSSGASALSLAVCGVFQSSATSPPVSPLFGLNDQYPKLRPFAPR